MNSQPQAGALFKPPPTRLDEIALALMALGCFRHSGPTVYVAAPITGGPRFVDWFKSEGRNFQQDRERFLHELRVAVIEPNSQNAARLIQDFGNCRVATFIDPSRLSIECWTQDDYRYFWSRVINDFAEEAIFLDGWHLSSGCAFEFLVASAKGIPIYTPSAKRLEFYEGLEFVENGLSTLASIGADTRFLESVVVELQGSARVRGR